MKKSSMFIGLDIHKTSIEIAIAEAGRDGEVRSYGGIDGTLDALDKVVRKLVSKGCNLHFVYEAGPCGYDVYRHLTAQGFDCVVVAPRRFLGRAATASKMIAVMLRCWLVCTEPAN